MQKLHLEDAISHGMYTYAKIAIISCKTLKLKYSAAL